MKPNPLLCGIVTATLLTACAAPPAGDAPGSTSPPSTDSTAESASSSRAATASPAAAVDEDQGEHSMANEGASGLDEDVLAAWGSAADLTSAFFENPPGLENITTRSSAVVVGRVIGRGDTQSVVGDTPDDVVQIPSMIVEIIEPLGGPRALQPGARITLRGLGVPPDVETLEQSEAVMFLRHLRDGFDGRPEPSFAEEADEWRLVSLEGVVVDRGDGRMVAPIGEVTQMLEADAGPDLEAWLTSDHAEFAGSEPSVTRDVRDLTRDDLLDRIRDFAG